MKKALIPLLLSLSLLHCQETDYAPIFAGTLLAEFSYNIQPGHLLLEPYFFIGNLNGTYDANWKKQHNFKIFEVQNLWLLETGITPWLDISLQSSGGYTSIHGKKTYLYSDTHLSLGFQISSNQRHTWVPDFRLILTESFPTGKYQKLNPKKGIAEISGSGAYETWLAAVVRKIIYFTPTQVVSANLSLQYDVPSNVHVKGANYYGGIPSVTNGTVRPGNQFIADLGLEYSLTINWILGLDIHYYHQNTSRPSHSPHAPFGLASSEQYSLAPCIEYNPSPNFGLEAGSWFTIAGRNTVIFSLGVVTVYWLF